MTPDVNVVTSRAILKETPMMMVGIRVIIWTRVMMSLDGFVDNHNEDDDDGDDDDGGGGGGGQPGGEVDQERQRRDTFTALGLYDVRHLKGHNMYTM